VEIHWPISKKKIFSISQNFFFFVSLPSGIIHLRQLNQLILNDVSLAELPKEIGR
jgi:hypothetical protein